MDYFNNVISHNFYNFEKMIHTINNSKEPYLHKYQLLEIITTQLDVLKDITEEYRSKLNVSMEIVARPVDIVLNCDSIDNVLIYAAAT